MKASPQAICLGFAIIGTSLLVGGCHSSADAPVKAVTPVAAKPKDPESKTGGKSTRRDIKTAIDSEASKINASPKDTTVEDIAAMKPPTGTDLAERVAPFETSTWKVKATLASVKLMKDGDYYLVLKGSKGGETVVEVPDPKDCQGSPLLPQITAARKQIEDRYHPTTDAKELHDEATVTGVGFLGFGSHKGSTGGKSAKGGKGRSGARLMPGLDFNF